MASGYTIANYLTAYGRWRYIQALINTLVMGAGDGSACRRCSPCRSPGPARAPTCRCKWLRSGWPCWRPSSCRPISARSAGSCWRVPTRAGSTRPGWRSPALPPLVNVFTLGGLILIMACNLFFFIFIFVTAALEMVSSEMEDAANILGAGTCQDGVQDNAAVGLPGDPRRHHRRFLQSIALFGVPALIAIPARYPVVTTQLWQFFEYPGPCRGRGGLRAAIARHYHAAIVAAAAHSVAGRATSPSTGKGGERRIVRLGAWRWSCWRTRCSWRPWRWSCRSWCWCRQRSPRPGGAASRSTTHVRQLRFMLFEHHGARPAIFNSSSMPVFRPPRHRARARHRLYRQPQPAAGRWRAGLPVHGAVRDPWRRAGDRLLCCLRAASPGAGWHCPYHYPGVPDAAAADRLSEQRRRHRQHPSRNGGSGARAGRRPADGHPHVVAPLLKRHWSGRGSWCSSRRARSCRLRSS